MAGETVLILGGGVGGLVAATELRRHLRPDQRVVLVDRSARHAFQPSFLWVMVGARRPEAVVRDLSSLERRGIEVVRGTVEALDPERRTVRVDGRDLQGDALVIALGAGLAPDRVPGLAEAGSSAYSPEGARAIGDALRRFTVGRLAVLVAGVPFKCPAAPYEAAMLLEHDLRQRRVRDRVEVSLYTPEAGPMGVAGPQVSAGVRRLVEQRGIAYHPQHRVVAVDAQAREMSFEDGTRASYDWLVYVAPHAAPAPVREAGLTDDSGWVPVDRHSLETRYQGVYAIGDVTTIRLASGAALPKAGVFAHGQAEVVAHNIAIALTGKGTPRAFDGRGG